jgi:hypothetical protein
MQMLLKLLLHGLLQQSACPIVWVLQMVPLLLRLLLALLCLLNTAGSKTGACTTLTTAAAAGVCRERA